MSKFWLITLSLGANAALVGTLALRSPAPIPAPGVSVVTNIVTKTVSRRPEVVTQTNWERLNWGAIESADYKTYIANLRAAGCPEETIRDLIIADVNKLYASRWRELHTPAGPWKFWEANVPAKGDPRGKKGGQDAVKEVKEDKQADDRRRLVAERDALIKELLGVDLKSELKKYAWDTDEKPSRALEFLTEDKREQVRELQDKFKEDTRDLMDAARANNLSREEAQKKLAELRAQERAGLAATLTPLELEEFDLRQSPLAGRLRAQLAGFEPTEQEFRSLFKLLNTGEAEAGGGARRGLTLAQLDADTQAKLQQVMGPERFAAFQQANDPVAQATSKAARRYGVSADAAAVVAAASQVAEQELRQQLDNPNLTPAQRAELENAVRAARKQAVAEALGGGKNQGKDRTKSGRPKIPSQ